MEFAFKLHKIFQILNLHLYNSNVEFAFKYDTRFLKYVIRIQFTQGFTNVEFTFELHMVYQVWNMPLNYNTRILICKICL